MIVFYPILCILATIFGKAVSLCRLPEADVFLYTFESTLLLNEVHVTTPETVDIGHKITGLVHLSRLWQNASDALHRLYHVRVSKWHSIAGYITGFPISESVIYDLRMPD